MPVLRHYKKKKGSYARAVIGQGIVTVQITPEGLQRLGEAGFIDEGAVFPQTLFNDLLRQREAFTQAGVKAEAIEAAEKSQYFFDFDADVAAQEQLPRCSETGTFEDLHLVVYRDPNEKQPVTRLLGEAPRKHLLAHVLLNIPLSLIDRNALRQLIGSGKIRKTEPVVARLSRWLERSTGESPWETHDIRI